MVPKSQNQKAPLLSQGFDDGAGARMRNHQRGARHLHTGLNDHWHQSNSLEDSPRVVGFSASSSKLGFRSNDLGQKQTPRSLKLRWNEACVPTQAWVQQWDIL